MEVSKLAMLFVMGSQPGDAPTGDPPSGAPTSLLVEGYGGPTKARLTWANADSTAYTRIYREYSSSCPQVTPILIDTVNPGETSYDSNVEIVIPAEEDDVTFVVRHYKNGQESAVSNCRQADAVTVPE